MSKKNIAIVYGGYSSEEVVSRKSAEGILSFIDKSKYNLYPVHITVNSWDAIVDGIEHPINKADFTFSLNGDKISFDCAYITIHGTPGEDGVLQGYFKLLNIAHSTCDLLPAAITFNKYTCNQYLKGFGFTVANSALVRKGIAYNIEEIAKKTGIPCFIKPNAGGSSFGVSKVKSIEEMVPAINKALNESDEVIIEQFIKGTEVTCGLYKTLEKTEIFPLTEVISENEFFDFEAKYTPEKVTEITPARIDNSTTLEIQNTTSIIYDLLGCKGFVRVDYIISDGRPFILEVNTTPGMTATSFIPQQIKAKELDITTVFSEIIEDVIIRNKHKK